MQFRAEDVQNENNEAKTRKSTSEDIYPYDDRLLRCEHLYK